jgi:hypothetical protein
MSQQQWYYSSKGQKHGPVAPEKLKALAASGQIQQADLVWKEGMAQWSEARNIKGLFEAPTKTSQSPPPIPAAASGPPPIPANLSTAKAVPWIPLTIDNTSPAGAAVMQPQPSEQRSSSQEPRRTSGMQRAGGIIALIAGIFSIFAAFTTLLVGGLGSAVGAEGGDTVIGLGWGGVLFSMITMVLGVINIIGKTKRPGYWLIGCSILGMILGGTFVAIFMVLALVGGIMAAVGGQPSTGTITSSSGMQVESKKGFSMDNLPPWARNKWVWVGGGCAAFLILLASVQTPEKSRPTSSDQTAGEPSPSSRRNHRSESSEPTPAIKTSAIQLVNDYKANEVAADQTYKGKIVEVSGVIESVAKDIMDTMYVSLHGGAEFEFRGVQCYFASKNTARLARLSKGLPITIKGQCDGLMGNVLLKNCIIVE